VNQLLAESISSKRRKESIAATMIPTNGISL